MEQYEIGRFDIAKSSIIKCVQTNGFTTLNDKNKALRLLSLIAIAEDSIPLAVSYINLIILNRIKKIKNSYKLDKTANQIVQI